MIIDYTFNCSTSKSGIKQLSCPRQTEQCWPRNDTNIDTLKQFRGTS